MTNNINAVPYLKPYIKNLLFLGGEIFSQGSSFFTCGDSAVAQLEGLYIQQAFYTVDGIDLMAGLTVNNRELCAFLQKINRIAKDTVILAESEKFDIVHMYRVKNFSPNTTLISDRSLSAKYAEFAFEHQVKILTSCAL